MHTIYTHYAYNSHVNNFVAIEVFRSMLWYCSKYLQVHLTLFNNGNNIKEFK